MQHRIVRKNFMHGNSATLSMSGLFVSKSMPCGQIYATLTSFKFRNSDRLCANLLRKSLNLKT